MTDTVVRALRDAGVIPDATAAALLPAPRRRAALCRNHRGSARRPEGPCSAPAFRVYENYSWEGDPDWELSHNLCAKCLPIEAEIYSNDPDHYRVKEIT